jgi:tetratricopeptide (TPR) repeat protein
MKKTFFLAVVLILTTSCVQKPKVVQEKARVVQEKETVEPDSVRIRKMNEELRSYLESMNNARMKFEKKDYNGAIAEYTKIIEESSSSSSRRVIFFEGSYPFNIYIARGLAKDSLQDYKGAIDDYTMAIDKSTGHDAEPYIKRGLSKTLQKDYEGAIGDFTKCMEFDPNNMWLYYYRGLAKIESGQKDNGCQDLKKAADFNSPNAKEAIKKYCN